MWKVVYDSVPGTSHIESGTPCQDACRFKEVANSRGSSLLIAVCADGAGSATHSDIGATIACDMFVRLAEEAIESAEFPNAFTRSDAVQWCEEIRSALLERADEMEVPIRELACTMLGAIIGETAAAFLQIGDGAMVVTNEGQFETVFWPQSGEYANTTNFLTDPEFEQFLNFSNCDRTLSKFAAFTDGLERLVLRFSDQTVHSPFLVPLLDAIAGAVDDNVESYLGSLRQFLESEKINERTNDDKTLILAVRGQGPSDVEAVP